MRVPTRLRVAGKLVRLKYVEELRDKEDNAIFGETTCSDHTIVISRSRPLSEEQVWATIVHELIHVVLDISGVSNVLKERTEEAVAHSLDALLAPMIQFRPDLRGATYREVEFDFESD